MTEKISLGEKYFGKRIVLGTLIHSSARSLCIKKYRMGLQNYTFIRLYINGIKKIVYIQNLGKEFFSKENEYNFDYIKDLKVECIMEDSIEENNKITMRSKNLQSKYIVY